MTISIGNDHADPDYKFAIVEYLESKGIQVTNHGTDSNDSVDYPDLFILLPKILKTKKLILEF